MIEDGGPRPLEGEEPERPGVSRAAAKTADEGEQRGYPQRGGHRPQQRVVGAEHIQEGIARERQLQAGSHGSIPCEHSASMRRLIDASPTGSGGTAASSSSSSSTLNHQLGWYRAVTGTPASGPV